MIKDREAAAYGMTCFNCDAEVEGNSQADVEREAIKASWSIGLLGNAQAYFSCPDCEKLLFNPSKLVPVLSADRPNRGE